MVSGDSQAATRGVSAAIALMGAPGAGKGTVARRLESDYGFVHVDMGEILRSRATESDDLAHQIRRTQRDGRLVPTDVVVTALNDHLSSLGTDGIVALDGFPRTTVQIAALDDGRVPLSLERAVWLHVPDDVAKARLRARAMSAARADDVSAIVDRRLALVRDTVDAVRAELTRRGILETVDGTAPVDEVYDNVTNCLTSMWVTELSSLAVGTARPGD